MILSQIAWIDCIAFVAFLIPQLLLHTRFLELLVVALKLPASFIYERYIQPKHARPPFVLQASPFQDFVIRCVRYAFARIPASIGRVFFSKQVALPFLRFRMLRHGIWRAPTPWEEIGEDGVRGIVISHDRHQRHDLVVYYVHGGGFSMGSAHFYLEPLLALHALLEPHYARPAVFALEYSLVPERVYPTQVDQTAAGYGYALALAGGDGGRVVVGGDSAGGTLVLSLLLRLGQGRRGSSSDGESPNSDAWPPLPLPGLAVLLSPWCALVSAFNRDTRSDYLSAASLHLYARQYAARPELVHDPAASPGRCTSLAGWRGASPMHGFYVTWGAEEVFAPEIENLVRRLRKAGVRVSAREEPGAVHAWVIASLFLAGGPGERLRGMREVVRAITANIEPLEKKV